MNGKHIVALGDCFNGLKFYGPFDLYEDALEWAERQGNVTWNIITLEEV